MPERAPIPGRAIRPNVSQGRKEAVPLPLTFGRESIGVPAGEYPPDVKYRRPLAFAQQPDSPANKQQMTAERNFIPFDKSTDTETMLATTKSTKERIKEARKRLDEQKDLPQNITRSLQDKYEKVGYILDAVEATLQLDQETEPELKKIIAEKLSPLATTYGLRIVEGDCPRDQFDYQRRIKLFIEAHLKKVEDTAIPESDLSFAPLDGTKQLPQSYDLYFDATHVKPEGKWKDHASVLNYSAVFNQFSDIQKYVPNKPIPSVSVGERRVTEKPLFHSNSVTRQLLYIGKRILWEGFNDRVFNDKIKDMDLDIIYLNSILAAFGLHVDVAS